MDTQTQKRFKIWQWRTIIVTMIGYAFFYFVRKNFSFAMPGLSAEYGISNTSFGIVMTIVGLVYGFSRYFNGILADRMNARYHMSIGLALCALASLAFGFIPQLLGIEIGDAPHTLIVVFAILLVLNIDLSMLEILMEDLSIMILKVLIRTLLAILHLKLKKYIRLLDCLRLPSLFITFCFIIL